MTLTVMDVWMDGYSQTCTGPFSEFLSHGRKRMWLAGRMFPTTGPYHLQCSVMFCSAWTLPNLQVQSWPALWRGITHALSQINPCTLSKSNLISNAQRVKGYTLRPSSTYFSLLLLHISLAHPCFKDGQIFGFSFFFHPPKKKIKLLLVNSPLSWNHKVKTIEWDSYQDLNRFWFFKFNDTTAHYQY